MSDLAGTSTNELNSVDEGTARFPCVEVLEQVQDALIIRDLEDRICFWNKGAERLYGWRADEVAGKDFYCVLFEGNGEGLRLQANQFAIAGEWKGELRQLTKAHKVIVVESHWKIQRDEFSRPACVLVINKDITEEKILKSEILLAERFETFSRLAGSVAHDLNTVLATMQISIKRLLREHSDLKDQYGLESWQFSVDHAAQLIHQLLSLGKDIGDERRSIDVALLIQETVKVLKHTFPASLRIESAVSPELHSVAGNATHLYQVFLNLCVNARDAMPSGGTLEIGAANVVLDNTSGKGLTAMKPGAYVRVRVADTGLGIPDEIIGKIFDPFFTTKEDGKGTGLGLFSVDRIIKNHSGYIYMETGQKPGTQFTVYLPAESTFQAEAHDLVPKARVATTQK